MSAPLIAQAFWFRLSVQCPRIEGIPKANAKGRLLDLPASAALPETTRLDGDEPWAEVRVAWNPAGLAVQVETTGTSAGVGSGDRPEGIDGFQLWVDTRDTRNVSRATRFCHRFSAKLQSQGARSALNVTVSQKPIARAVADAPMSKADAVIAKAERLKNGWRMEIFLPAEALNGFDPETNRRLGFAYQVSDAELSDQFMTVGREFPIGENPSLWSTLELVDEPETKGNRPKTA
ncbi:hypothetical protein [Singulisphaera sp. PoT]|uniref:hypothetical protein n=1 Tax=Singulisphaera sp. PoT TaxID=3411797 RepID=UPI003BF60488